MSVCVCVCVCVFDCVATYLQKSVTRVDERDVLLSFECVRNLTSKLNSVVCVCVCVCVCECP